MAEATPAIGVSPHPLAPSPATRERVLVSLQGFNSSISARVFSRPHRPVLPLRTQRGGARTVPMPAVPLSLQERGKQFSYQGP